MDISSIIQEVMRAIDEEYVTSGAHIDTQLSESIEKSVRTAAKQTLRWLALYAPVEMLDGSDESESPGFHSSTSNATVSDGSIELPASFVRLARVRESGWHRAISETILDTQEDYLALSDETAAATADRPVAAIVLSNPKRLELWPYNNGTVQLDIVCQPELSLGRLDEESGDTTVPIPPKVHMAFIYHTAFLVLLSYRDSSAATFREVAFNSLGITNNKK